MTTGRGQRDLSGIALPGYPVPVSDRARLPAGMQLRQTSPVPNQAYDVLFDDAMIGTCEHQEGWPASRYWLFTDLDGTQIWVAVGHNYADGAAWLKSAYEDGPGPAAAPAPGQHHGAGHETDHDRKQAVEAHAVDQVMACFPLPYDARDVGASKPGYDVAVTAGDGQRYHIEVKGTRLVCGTVQITEGERAQLVSCTDAVHALCVVSQISALPLPGGGWHCSGGVLEWLWPWAIAQQPGDPGLKPVEYRYTVPEGRYTGPVPPPS
jgi:Domain of unknown function (DUF3883)